MWICTAQPAKHTRYIGRQMFVVDLGGLHYGLSDVCVHCRQLVSGMVFSQRYRAADGASICWYVQTSKLLHRF